MKKILAAIILLCSVNAAQAQYQNTKIKVGQKAPELELVDTAGKVVKLSSLMKDKVVLLDFWASWCRPCRMANPRVVQLYKDYSSKKFKNAKKGFTVVSVSLDQNKDGWVNAIKADGLVWNTHISDLGGWNSRAAKEYGLEFIPQAMLIGADGKVLATNTSAEQVGPELDKMLKK